MTPEKLRKKQIAFKRKQRRNKFLKAYKELKSQIYSDAKKGKGQTYLEGRLNYEYAVAARLFYRKNKGFYVFTAIKEINYLKEYAATKIIVSWDLLAKPEFKNRYTYMDTYE